jgi:hypothetical protein
MADKVKEICCYDCSLTDINRVYANQLPVYLRGITTSREEGVVLPGFSEAGNDVPISSIDHILKEGTELVLTNGVPIDRPNDFIKDGVITRVAIYNGNPNSFEMMFVRNAFRNLDRFVHTNLPPELQKAVIPAILVYDSSKVKRIKQVEIALPHNPDLRRDSLLGVYLLTQQFK